MLSAFYSHSTNIKKGIRYPRTTTIPLPFGLLEIDFPFLKVPYGSAPWSFLCNDLGMDLLAINCAFVVKHSRQETLRFEITGRFWDFNQQLQQTCVKLSHRQSHLPVIGRV